MTDCASRSSSASPSTTGGSRSSPLFPLATRRRRTSRSRRRCRAAFAIAEVERRRAACPSSLVQNPLDEHVLLYDGEELIGAKQNRILNLSVLVAAGSRTAIPV